MQESGQSDDLPLFSPMHIWVSLKTMFKPRPQNRRMYLILLIITMLSIYVPFVGEGSIRYLYVRERYHWEVDEYSAYNTVNTIASTICKFHLLLKLKACLNYRYISSPSNCYSIGVSIGNT